MFDFFFKYSRATFERGELVFASGWPLWLLIALLVLAAAAVGVSLWRRQPALGVVRVIALGTLQTALIAVLLVLALWGAITLANFLDKRIHAFQDLTPSIQELIAKLVRIALITLAIVGDLRVIRMGGLKGPRRLARHLWRMCFALFIAAASFFSIRARVADWH